ncbi:hypothetical protein HELRODRAFT_172666 [Helobdella robusta]|uniref:Uncharacterized protein n=1 Tax=Helobdella robusta TaxID=6412 RepID=T1F5R6_HELRO|nr:hypothetical protein HELRODRAFT_172666 [Helobdella robusta]ESO04309.1 hypothetical protein HELRODRAFT_172666 [Helobdella robusta]
MAPQLLCKVAACYLNIKRSRNIGVVATFIYRLNIYRITIISQNCRRLRTIRHDFVNTICIQKFSNRKANSTSSEESTVSDCDENYKPSTNPGPSITVCWKSQIFVISHMLLVHLIASMSLTWVAKSLGHDISDITLSHSSILRRQRKYGPQVQK